MCGIIGCNGSVSAVPYLLEGLERLEYRGYDSSGIAVVGENGLLTEKHKGRIFTLAKAMQSRPDMDSTTGIGHTRWATHGEPSDRNAHPHGSGKFALVHNGIIENYAELKEKYLQGCAFESDTDTEVIVRLLDRNYDGDCLQALVKTCAMLRGSYALAVLCEDEPDSIFCARMSSPLLVGVGNGVWVASDVCAIGDRAGEIYRLADGEFAVCGKDCVKFYNSDACEIGKKPSDFGSVLSAVDKGNCEHFMMKEIYEEPEAVRRTVDEYTKDGKIKLDLNTEKPQRLYIVACGSAYHVGLVGKYFLEELLKIPVEVDIASEFRYRKPLVSPETPVIIISQSGETADSLAALREAKARGAKTLSIVNVPESSIALESDSVLYTKAGTEIAVATTKAYGAQLAALYLLGLHLAEKWETAHGDTIAEMTHSLITLHGVLSQALSCEEQVKKLAQRLMHIEHAYFIGRGLGYAAAAEASLKLKEISYIHSEAYAAGEMKHGTISLIEPDTAVFAMCAQNGLNAKLQSNIDEVRARGARVFAVSADSQINADEVITIPKTHPLFSVSLQVIPMQLFGYYMAKFRGCDIDKPRNLAKSVTVE